MHHWKLSYACKKYLKVRLMRCDANINSKTIINTMNHTITQTRYLTQTIKQKVYIFCTRKRMRSTKPKQTYREETTITIIILSTTKARAFKNTWKLLPICKNGEKDYGISLNVTQLYRPHTSSQFQSKNISRVYVSCTQVKQQKKSENHGSSIITYILKLEIIR